MSDGIAPSSPEEARCFGSAMPCPESRPRRPPAAGLSGARRASVAVGHLTADLLALTARLDAFLHHLVLVPLAGRRTVPAGVGARPVGVFGVGAAAGQDRKSTRLNSSHSQISYAVF